MHEKTMYELDFL